MSEVREADDLAAVGRVLDAFNREYDEPSPGPEFLAGRLAELTDTTVLVTGDPLIGLAVLRFRPSLWSPGLECYLAELYVVPEHRGHGHGRALMDAALALARERGADHFELGTDDDDTTAHALYSRSGLKHTSQYWEREL